MNSTWLYGDRRGFSDKVHKLMAINVYKTLKWRLDNSRNIDYMNDADIKDGIDYYILNEEGMHRTVQERFRRESSAKNYDDITIRYNYVENDLSSEWFKITADYFMYGVIKGEHPSASSKFKKLVVVDFQYFKHLLEKRYIKVDKKARKSYIDENGVLHSGFRHNKSIKNDKVTTFVTFRVRDLYELSPELIVIEKGYETGKDIMLSEHN